LGAVGGALLVLAAFMAGSIPWGLVLGRALGGVDIRTVGSRSTGATNALRVLGWRVSLAVFVLDFLKGLVPVVVGRLLGLDPWIVGAAGVAAVVGHCWSPWIGFKGGKGMATGAGAAIGLAPWLLLLLPVTVLIVWLTRYVSLGSLVSALGAVVAVVVAAAYGSLSWAWVVAVTLMVAIIVAKHQSNIQRLLSGTERRFGESANPTAS
jgi:acyl phosphate:glycerol-3-phosphate acyltransferase